MEAKKVILLAILCLQSCVTTQQKLDPLVYYKRDMKIEVNGRKGYGTLVVPKSGKYEIKAWFPGKGDLLTIKTCHREHEWEKTGRREKFNFRPTEGLEDSGLCYLEVAAFEHKKGRHAWAMVDFETERFTLPATIKCNGATYASNGVTICQAKEGSIQYVEFSERVTPARQGKCGALNSNDDQIFQFKMPNRECTFLFKGRSGKLHKLTTIGYEQLLIRELR